MADLLSVSYSEPFSNEERIFFLQKPLQLGDKDHTNAQVAFTVVNPGLSTVIDPTQIHIVLLVSSMAGLPPILSFLATGDHGIKGSGMQEEGINTGTGPTIFQFIGLAGEVQLPKAGTFNMGIKSILVAMGFVVAVNVIPIGNTSISLGPEPKEHFNLAPMQTHLGIHLFLKSKEKQ